jgi:hypothetical protein
MKNNNTALLIFIGLIFFGCGQPPGPDSMENPPLPPSGGNAGNNGPLTDTIWSAFAYHVYTGSNASGNNPMDPSNIIFIGDGTTSLLGEFWGDYKGTYYSYYSENNPAYVMSTAPRIFVIINRNEFIEIIQGSQADYGTIMWVRTSLDGDRIDVYFRYLDFDEYNDLYNDDGTPSSGKWTVSSLAGTTTAGYAEGVGTAARFSSPQSIAFDTSGNTYVADTGNNRIRKITSSGEVSNLAGNGTAGYANGTGTAAMFSAPQGIASDASGNIYVADTSNNRIRIITPEGVVASLAGTNTAGYADGMGTSVQFSSPQGITVNVDSVIFIADTGNNRIRKMSYE